MADIQARKSGRIRVEFWHTDWHARIQIGTDPDCCLWLTREEAERLPNQIRKALAERDEHDRRYAAEQIEWQRRYGEEGDKR